MPKEYLEQLVEDYLLMLSEFPTIEGALEWLVEECKNLSTLKALPPTESEIINVISKQPRDSMKNWHKALLMGFLMGRVIAR